ncbi:MAG: glycerol-3-phosphate acyltransferase [Thermoleophilia bacterium]
MSIAIAIVVGWVLGGMPWGYWLPKLVKGVDVRTHGSGNVGAANVARAAGSRMALAVVALDIGKGVATGLIGNALGGPWAAVLAGGAAMIGHWRPWALRMKRGGKSVAVGGGVLLALAPLASVGTLVIWAVVFGVGRYSSVASLSGAIAAPVLCLLLDAPLPVTLFALGGAVAIVALHRSNIGRLVRGTEHRFQFRGRGPAAETL